MWSSEVAARGRAANSRKAAVRGRIDINTAVAMHLISLRLGTTSPILTAKIIEHWVANYLKLEFPDDQKEPPAPTL
jgi:hypothetical protein